MEIDYSVSPLFIVVYTIEERSLVKALYKQRR